MEELVLTEAMAKDFRALLYFAHDKVDPNRIGKRRSARILARQSKKKQQKIIDQDGMCLDCLRDIFFHHGCPDYLKATFEHVIPYRYGSSMGDHNIVLLCGSCNQKRDRFWDRLGKTIIEDHYGPVDWDYLKSIPIVEMAV